jgi:hypothetical protein
MEARRVIRCGLVSSVMLIVTACDPETSELFIEPQVLSYRAGGGMWIGNGLEDPDISGVDPAFGLGTSQGLDPNGPLLADAAGIELATYIVECALPANQSVSKTRNGQTIVFQGLLGLASAWQAGACDQTCQQWVTACLLARTNASGESVGIWVTADHPAIGLGQSPAYPHYEATFYGNLFQDPDSRYLCRSDPAMGEGEMGAYLEERTCAGEPPEACGFTDWEACTAPSRCIFNKGHATLCAEGNQAEGARYRSISTFVAQN